MEGKPVVIRTLDIGGDKNLPALNLEPEINPFLGLPGDPPLPEEQSVVHHPITGPLPGFGPWSAENHVSDDLQS